MSILNTYFLAIFPYFGVYFVAMVLSKSIRILCYFLVKPLLFYCQKKKSIFTVNSEHYYMYVVYI